MQIVASPNGALAYRPCAYGCTCRSAVAYCMNERGMVQPLGLLVVYICDSHILVTYGCTHNRKLDGAFYA